MSYSATSTDDHHDHKPGFFVRWFFSTNHKDIGTLYFIYAIIAGVIGGALSVIMRMELADPGIDVVADGQMWNVIISAHGLLMIFFCGNASTYWWIWKLVCTTDDRSA